MKQRAAEWHLTQDIHCSCCYIALAFVVNMYAVCWLWGQPGPGFRIGSSFLPGDAPLWVVCRLHLCLCWSPADQAKLVSSA